MDPRLIAKYVFACVILITVSGCGLSHNYAPVTHAWYAPPQESEFHRVRQGETLYAIAWRYGLDYRDLAHINNLYPPYHLKIGEKLKLKANKKQIKSIGYNKKAKKITQSRTKTRKWLSKINRTNGFKSVKYWFWPTRGKIVKRYSPIKGSKGIDIAGRAGQAIRAAASGRIAYSGSGLRGYGKLLIIKHNSEFLSAYAHNRKLLVKEGAWVKAGQRIAEMGKSGTHNVILHFELRKAGKPVNPLSYLKRH